MGLRKRVIISLVVGNIVVWIGGAIWTADAQAFFTASTMGTITIHTGQWSTTPKVAHIHAQPPSDHKPPKPTKQCKYVNNTAQHSATGTIPSEARRPANLPRKRKQSHHGSGAAPVPAVLRRSLANADHPVGSPTHRGKETISFHKRAHGGRSPAATTVIALTPSDTRRALATR